MRRILVGMAIMALMSMPISAWAGDREIAEQIISKLKSHRDSGALKDFKVDLKVKDGVVALKGSVATIKQRELVLDVTDQVAGIKNVVDEMRLPAIAKDDSKGSSFVTPQLADATPASKQSYAMPPKTHTNPLATSQVIEAATQLVKPRSKTLKVAESKPSIKSPKPKLVAQATTGIVKPAGAVVVPEAIASLVNDGDTKLASAVEPIKRSSGSKTTGLKKVTVQPVAPKPVAIKPVVAAGRGDLDRALNAKITEALTKAKSEGILRGFAMDITTNLGDVWLRGRTINAQQRDAVLDIVRNVRGVTNVINDIQVMVPAAKENEVRMIRQASDVEPLPPTRTAVRQVAVPEPLMPAAAQPIARRAAPQPSVVHAAPAATMQRSPARMVPVPYRRSAMPQPYAPASMQGYAGGAPGQPMPMQTAGGAYGAPRHDQPNLPNYAWPGYAAAPNYAALSYPKQYSPSAWPFIGPFYPYPQVPLNWRKVTLQWDDGWWFLDYSSKSR